MSDFAKFVLLGLCVAVLILLIGLGWSWGEGEEGFAQSMIISGVINATDYEKPETGDRVVVFNATQGDTKVSSGSVIDSTGRYSVTVSLPSEYSGNILYFQLKKKSSGDIHDLVVSADTGAPRAEVSFSGGFPFPVTYDLDMYVGPLVSQGGTSGGGTSGGGGSSEGNAGPSSKYDVNGDGRVDREDVAVIGRVRVGATLDLSESEIKAADVNGDGVVDFEDIVEAMRQIGE